MPIFENHFKLIPTKHDEACLNRAMKILGSHYFNVQKKYVAKWNFITNTKLFKNYVANGYKGLTKEEKKEKQAGWRKLCLDNGFSYFSFRTFWKINKHYKENGVNSKMLGYTSRIAWSAWEKKLTDLSIDVNLNQTSKIVGWIECFTVDFARCEVKVSGLNLTIPFVFKGTEYECFNSRNKIKQISITKKYIRGKAYYELHLYYEGIPYNKGRKHGDLKVGIDPSLQNMILSYSDGRAEKVSTALEATLDTEKETRLSRKLDRQRRANNPTAFDENGLCVVEKGYKWKHSKRMLRTKNQLANLRRKYSDTRKIHQFKLANDIISQVSVVNIEDNNYNAFARRAKETTVNKKGKFNSKKRFGKSIGNGSPSQFVTILKNKANFNDVEFNVVPARCAATQFDHTNGEFVKHELKERKVTLNDGTVVDRDIHAAANILAFIPRKKVETKKAENFNIEIIEAYWAKNKAIYEENTVNA